MKEEQKMRTAWAALALFLAVTVMAVQAGAQSSATADLKGIIYDPTGAVVPGATVQATNLGSKVTATTTSTGTGEYFFRFMPPGTYKLTVNMQGFAVTTIPEVVLLVSVDVRLPITLKTGSLEQTVEVFGEAPTVNTTDGTLTRTVTNEQVSGLPIFSSVTGRTVLDQLPFLLPGVTPTYSLGPTDSRGGYMSINGGRASSIAFNFEGGDNMDPESNRAASPMPNPDVLREFTVITNSYKAETGRAGSGVINAVTKSGTDVYHGQLRYFMANEALNAREFTRGTKDTYRVHTGGGQFSGPVRIPGLFNGRERTQFLFDVEHTTSKRTNLYNRATYTKAERGGDFSHLITPALTGTNTGPVMGGFATPGVCNSALRGDPNVTLDSAANAAAGKYQYWLRSCTMPRNPFGPRDTTGTLTGTVGRPTTFFENGIIPTSLFNPIAKYYLDNFIPLPNDPLGGRNYTEDMPYSQGNRQYTLKIDHKFSNSDTLAVTYFQTKTNTMLKSTTNIPVGTGQGSRNNNYNVTIRETHIFTPRVVNQVSLTGTRFFYPFTSNVSPGVEGVHPKEAGYTGINPQSERFLGLPNLVLSATGGPYLQLTSGSGFAQGKTTVELKDDLTVNRGRHDLKFGVQIRTYHYNMVNGNNNGSFSFSGAGSLYGAYNPSIDFLLGFPASYSQSTGQFRYSRQKSYAAYAQDDWRVTPTLTLNLGVRYELTPPVADKNAQMVAWRPGMKSEVMPGAPLGLLYGGDPDPILGVVPKAGYPTDKNNLSPRFGFAWAPRPEGGLLKAITGRQTSIRGGFGMYFDTTYGTGQSMASTAAPFSVSQSITAQMMYENGGTYANPFGTLTNPWPLDMQERTWGTAGQGKMVTLPIAITPYSPGFRTAYVYQYNLTIQRELPHNLTMEVAYVGNNSFKLQRQQQDNYAILAPGATTGNVNNRRIYYCAVPTVSPNFTCATADQRLNSIMTFYSDGRSNYNSLQARLTRRFSKGLSFDTSYTFGKALDSGTNPHVSNLGNVSLQNRFARSSNDRKHQWVVTAFYDMPIIRSLGPVPDPIARFVGYVTSGWRIGAIASYRTGTPIDIGQSIDTTLAGMQAPTVPYGTVDYVGPWKTFNWKEVRTITVPGSTQPVTARFYFDPNAFALVPTPTDWTQARAGNLGRNVFNYPNLYQFDMSIIRRFRVSERHGFELRADVANILNHPQGSIGANKTISSSGAGQISRGFGERIIQVQARYTF